MAEERVQRRLAAILAADVVGYSRLMGEDEEGTLATLTAHLTELIQPCIAEHRGRVVKMTGDGLLADFGSVVNAVKCAVAFQEGMTDRNTNTPKDSRIEFRIGVNLGDVIIDGDDIHGDGVNVAARLEGLSGPGEVYVSGSVHDQVVGKLEANFEDLGERTVKNIARPIQVYRARLSPSVVGRPESRADRAMTLLPDRPSVAVLPFQNMSGDPGQEHLADGMAEEIITALSKISELQVIARNSTFVYKGRAVKVSEVADNLGAGYVLEGSVRAAGDRVRITAQLIEAETERHVWAERYDREISDIFALQDEITNEIVVALQVNLSEGDQARLRRRQTDNLEAWECYLRGARNVASGARADYDQGRERLERAVTLDPNFAVAWVLLGRLYWHAARAHWTGAPEASFGKAVECAERALAIDNTLPDTIAFVGMMRLFQRRYDEAIAAAERAVELGANSAETYITLAHILTYVDRAEEASALLERSMRLFRYYPDNLLGVQALCYRRLGRYDEALALDAERLRRNPDNLYSDFRLASVYLELGRVDDARRHIAEAIKKNPNCSVRQIRFSEPFRDERYMDNYLDLLRQAGLPE